jgi:hypothetical protein
MNISIDKIVSPYYCQAALQLCVTSRALCKQGNCIKASEICSFISTLCSQTNFNTCGQESDICSYVSKLCSTGKDSAECKKAQKLCSDARKLCPRNNQIDGA